MSRLLVWLSLCIGIFCSSLHYANRGARLLGSTLVAIRGTYFGADMAHYACLERLAELKSPLGGEVTELIRQKDANHFTIRCLLLSSFSYNKLLSPSKANADKALVPAKSIVPVIIEEIDILPGRQQWHAFHQYHNNWNFTCSADIEPRTCLATSVQCI